MTHNKPTHNPTPAPAEPKEVQSLFEACCQAGETLGLCRTLLDNPNLPIRDAFPDEETRVEVLKRIDAAGRQCDEAVEAYQRERAPGRN